MITAKILISIGILGIVGLIIFQLCFRFISSSPPYVALTTLWNKRKWRKNEKVEIKQEGLRFFAPFFPFYYSYIPIKIEKFNHTFHYKNIRCKAKNKEGEIFSGGEVEITIEITITPDYETDEGERLISFIDSGMMEGIIDILDGVIEEDIRQMGKEYDWEAITFASDELVSRLLKKLTGREAYQDQTTGDLQQEAQKNGLPDVRSLGIKFWRFNVGQIKEQGQLEKYAESRAIEEQQREAEVYEVETEITQAKQLMTAYKEVDQEKTLEECILEIRRRKAIREGHGTIYDIPGLDKLKIGIGWPGGSNK